MPEPAVPTALADLPDPFPIVPLAAPPDALIRVPGGRSITNRALVAAGLAEGTTVLRGAGTSDDTEAMVDCLRALGAAVDVAPAPGGADITVSGVAGRPGGGVDVFTRLSGTTSRFVTAVAALADGPVRVDAAPPMRARPMADLVVALRALGVAVDEEGESGHLPLVVTGPLSGHEVLVPGTVSSQFLSGLLLAAGARPGLPFRVRLSTDRLVSAPYVAMTAAVMAAYGVEVEGVEVEGVEVEGVEGGANGDGADAPGRGALAIGRGGYRAPEAGYDVEPDAATAGYFLAAAAITGGRVTVPGLPSAGLQADAELVDVLDAMGATVTRSGRDVTVAGPAAAGGPGGARLRGGTFDLTAFSDMAPTVAVLAAFAAEPVEVTGVGFIRGKESDRIAASVAELQRCGVPARETDDGFVVWPDGRPAGAEPHGAVIRTYDDHRMAMSFALLGLVVPGVAIADPGCVAKTHPGFFADLDRLRTPAR
ncbi:MAG TPA: 3-phosphoshikimate 1-carboxyvinyltransferase [Acidimicrobiales bacterium]|nr:3-phosphoshikimate 1-carboxyvinyltransferase [Acidimicrobiales bacterium]